MDHHTEGAAMKNKCLRDNREISTWTSGLVFISRGDTLSVSLLVISIWGKMISPAVIQYRRLILFEKDSFTNKSVG